MKEVFKSLAIIALTFVVLSPSISEAAKREKLAKVLSPKMLSVDLAYFEKIAGVAKNTYENIKVYDIDDCEVTATIENGSVAALRVDLTPKCTFDLNKFLDISPEKFPAPYKMTFGEFDTLTNSMSEFMADCLGGCGNAADPVVYEYKSGTHAEGWIDILLEATTTSKDAALAFRTWTDALEKGEGIDWIMNQGVRTGNDKLICNPQKYNSIAHNAFRNVRISAITFGHNISKAQCQ
jgi:hypothetical protein